MAKKVYVVAAIRVIGTKDGELIKSIIRLDDYYLREEDYRSEEAVKQVLCNAQSGLEDWHVKIGHWNKSPVSKGGAQ